MNKINMDVHMDVPISRINFSARLKAGGLTPVTDFLGVDCTSSSIFSCFSS